MFRIAARLHLADHFDKSSGWEGWVDVGTMQRAIRLGDYYLNHALIAFDLMGGDETRDRMRYILRLFADRPEKFAQPFTRDTSWRLATDRRCRMLHHQVA